MHLALTLGAGLPVPLRTSVASPRQTWCGGGPCSDDRELEPAAAAALALSRSHNRSHVMALLLARRTARVPRGNPYYYY